MKHFMVVIICCDYFGFVGSFLERLEDCDDGEVIYQKMCHFLPSAES